MRGVPGRSKDIFKDMKKTKEVHESASVSNNVSQTSDFNGYDRQGMDNNLGAYASIQKRKKVEEVKEDVKVTVAQKSKLDVVSIDNFFIESLNMYSNAKDMPQVLRILMSMYINGSLEDYDITGIDVGEIKALIGDFEETVSRVLK
jgi:hypothetical protein